MYTLEKHEYTPFDHSNDPGMYRLQELVIARERNLLTDDEMPDILMKQCNLQAVGEVFTVRIDVVAEDKTRYTIYFSGYHAGRDGGGAEWIHPNCDDPIVLKAFRAVVEMYA